MLLTFAAGTIGVMVWAVKGGMKTFVVTLLAFFALAMAYMGNERLTIVAANLKSDPPAVQGNWLGVLATPNGNLHLVFHLSAGGSGTVDSPDQHSCGIPLQYSTNANQVEVSISSISASYSGAVNGNQMAGTFTQGMQIPLNLTKGSIPCSPLAPPPAPGPGTGAKGVQGSWRGVLATPSGSLRVVFHLSAGGNGTTDSPDQHACGAPLKYSTNGNQISVSIPSFGASYSGTVNGNQMTGTFTQGGQLPLTMNKGTFPCS